MLCDDSVLLRRRALTTNAPTRHKTTTQASAQPAPIQTATGTPDDTVLALSMLLAFCTGIEFAPINVAVLFAAAAVSDSDGPVALVPIVGVPLGLSLSSVSVVATNDVTAFVVDVAVKVVSSLDDVKVEEIAAVVLMRSVLVSKYCCKIAKHDVEFWRMLSLTVGQLPQAGGTLMHSEKRFRQPLSSPKLVSLSTAKTHRLRLIASLIRLMSIVPKKALLSMRISVKRACGEKTGGGPMKKLLSMRSSRNAVKLEKSGNRPESLLARMFRRARCVSFARDGSVPSRLPRAITIRSSAVACDNSLGKVPSSFAVRSTSSTNAGSCKTSGGMLPESSGSLSLSSIVTTRSTDSAVRRPISLGSVIGDELFVVQGERCFQVTQQRQVKKMKWPLVPPCRPG